MAVGPKQKGPGLVFEPLGGSTRAPFSEVGKGRSGHYNSAGVQQALDNCERRGAAPHSPGVKLNPCPPLLYSGSVNLDKESLDLGTSWFSSL